MISAFCHFFCRSYAVSSESPVLEKSTKSSREEHLAFPEQVKRQIQEFQNFSLGQDYNQLVVKVADFYHTIFPEAGEPRVADTFKDTDHKIEKFSLILFDQMLQKLSDEELKNRLIRVFQNSSPKEFSTVLFYHAKAAIDQGNRVQADVLLEFAWKTNLFFLLFDFLKSSQEHFSADFWADSLQELVDHEKNAFALYDSFSSWAYDFTKINKGLLMRSIEALLEGPFSEKNKQHIVDCIAIDVQRYLERLPSLENLVFFSLKNVNRPNFPLDVGISLDIRDGQEGIVVMLSARQNPMAQDLRISQFPAVEVFFPRSQRGLQGVLSKTSLYYGKNQVSSSCEIQKLIKSWQKISKILFPKETVAKMCSYSFPVFICPLERQLLFQRSLRIEQCLDVYLGVAGKIKQLATENRAVRELQFLLLQRKENQSFLHFLYSMYDVGNQKISLFSRHRLFLKEMFWSFFPFLLEMKSSSFEEAFLDCLKKQIDRPLYEQVYRIVEENQGEYQETARQVLQYVKTLQGHCSSSQIDWINQFTWKMVIFSHFSSLVKKNCLTFEEIESTLQASKDSIEELKNEFDLNSFFVTPSIDLAEIEKLMECVLPENLRENQKQYAKVLHVAINDLFAQKSWKEYGSARLHKLKVGLPFSCHIRHEGSEVLIKVLQDRIGVGGYKKTIKARIFSVPLKEGLLSEKKTEAISRIKGISLMKEVLSGYFFHRRILEIPGASQYFVPLPTFSYPYQGGVGTKYEWSSPLFEGNFAALSKDMSVGSCLDRLLEVATGIEILAKHAISHGDIKANNILIENKEGKRRALISDFDLAREFDCKIGSFSSQSYRNFLFSVKVFSKETDIYSLCKMVVNVLFQERPRETSIKDLSSILEIDSADPLFINLLNHQDPASIQFFKQQIQSSYGKKADLKQKALEKCLILQEVYSLFEKVSQADLKTKETFEKVIDEECDFSRAQQIALDSAKFPSLSEVKDSFLRCQKILAKI